MTDLTLKDEDINISQKTNVNCLFEKGYTFQKNNNSFNQNDTIGIRNILLFIFIIVCLSIGKRTLVLMIAGVLILLYDLIRNPIHIIYMISSLITINTCTPPFLDIDKYFPNHYIFENPYTFNKIKEEAMFILSQKDKLKLTKNTYGNKYIGGGEVQSDNEDGWRIYAVKLGNINYAEDTMPELTKLLSQVPEVVSCAVSILPARKAIPIHVGYSKGVLRYQIAMKVPKDRENVFICVNGIKYSWTEGEGVLFDDTYPHKVYNNTDEDRVVLYMDVIRPFLSPILDILNKFVIYLVTNSPIVKEEIARTEKPIELK